MTVIKVDTAVLDRIIKELPERVERVGRKMAFVLEGYAKRNAPVDTGALRNSIYTVTKTSDGYGAAASGTKGRTTEEHPTPSGKIIANVGPCVDYAEFQEFGTSKMAAQPYMTPAVEQVEKDFNDPKNWEEIIA